MSSALRVLAGQAWREITSLMDQNHYRRPSGRPRYAHAMYVLPIPVILAWIALAGRLNLAVPQLESVIGSHAQSFLPDDAPSVQAISKMGKYFGQSGTNNVVYILLEGDRPLDASAHTYAADPITTLRSDTIHVVSVFDLWSDPDFAAADQSADDKSAYALLNLTGNMGTAQVMRSTAAVRDVVAGHRAPQGVRVYVTEPSAVVNDELVAINRSILVILATRTVLISAVLIWVYRSPVTIALPLLTVGMGIAVARLNLQAFTREDFTTSVIATVAMAYLASLGLATRISQHLLHNPLHWSVAPIAFTFLVEVGADYNLLLVARFKQELSAGRSTGSFDPWSTPEPSSLSAGLVFGFSMFGMLASSAHNIAQIGAVAGNGLFLDTLVIRTFIIPAIAVLAGRWFWWPPNTLLARQPFAHRHNKEHDAEPSASAPDAVLLPSAPAATA